MAAIDIILEIYSGRPNPRLVLRDDELDELRTRLEQVLRARRRGARQAPALGYRGFIIFNPRREAGLPFRVDVHAGSIAVTEEAPAGSQAARREPEVFQDAAQLEDWLLARAAERGYADDIARMGGPAPRTAR